MCTQKLSASQLNLPHGNKKKTNNETNFKKLLLRRINGLGK